MNAPKKSIRDGDKGSAVKRFGMLVADAILGTPVPDVVSAPAALPYNVWREDTLESREFSKDLIVEQFPDAHDGFLKVKKIL